MSEESDDPQGGWGVLVPGRGRIGHKKCINFVFFLSLIPFKHAASNLNINSQLEMKLLP